MIDLKTLPPSLRKNISIAGAHRRGLKSIWFGGPKFGKSWALASHPGPRLVAVCGESGIEPYLEEGDLPLFVSTPAEYADFVDFALTRRDDEFASLLFDNHNLLWSDYMDAKQDELGVDEIKGKHWRKVKGPWKILLRRLMRAKMHLGMSVWIKETKWTTEGGAPGEEGKLAILPQAVPDGEKTVPYVADLLFQCDVGRNALQQPNGTHKVIFYGGRRPRSVPPTELYVGKVWTFDAKKIATPNVWDIVIKPLYERWTTGAGAVDYLGIDPIEAEDELGQLATLDQDETVGRLIRTINECSEEAKYRPIFEGIQQEFLKLTRERQLLVQEAHAKKKREFEAGKK